MRSMVLSKSRWRRWRRALRSEERSGGAREWWWRLLAVSIPEEEREVIQNAHGKALNAVEWKEWWSGERGTQGHSLLQEFYEEQPSGCRTAWHRRQLWVIYGTWKDQTPLEATLQGKGEAALEDWASQGRVGTSKWPRQRGEVVTEEQWSEMLRDLRERQKATTERVMEIRQQRKKQKQERAEEEAAARRRCTGGHRKSDRQLG